MCPLAIAFSYHTIQAFPLRPFGPFLSFHSLFFSRGGGMSSWTWAGTWHRYWPIPRGKALPGTSTFAFLRAAWCWQLTVPLWQMSRNKFLSCSVISKWWGPSFKQKFMLLVPECTALHFVLLHFILFLLLPSSGSSECFICYIWSYFPFTFRFLIILSSQIYSKLCIFSVSLVAWVLYFLF